MASPDETRTLAARQLRGALLPQSRESRTQYAGRQESRARKKEVHQPSPLRSPEPMQEVLRKESANLPQPLCLAKDATRTLERRSGGVRSARPPQDTSPGQILNSPRNDHWHPNSRAESTLHLHQRTGKPKRTPKHTMEGEVDPIRV